MCIGKSVRQNDFLRIIHKAMNASLLKHEVLGSRLCLGNLGNCGKLNILQNLGCLLNIETTDNDSTGLNPSAGSRF